MAACVKPVVVVSRCLGFDPVRYDGEVIPNEFVRQLAPWVRYVPVCPEVEIGLGVPRDPIRIVTRHGERRLVQPTTGRRLTREMTRFARGFLSSLRKVDGFILKSRSPSCGIRDAKIYESVDPASRFSRGQGFFAREVLQRFDGLAIEDEARLLDNRIRERFLTKLFALARLRSAKRTQSVRELVRFHEENDLLLTAYSRTQARALGRILTNARDLPFAGVIALYEPHFRAAFARAPRCTSVINVVGHAAGLLSNRLTRAEKELLQAEIERHRSHEAPATALARILRGWAARFDEAYLRVQTMFDPYPAALMSDSEQGAKACGTDRTFVRTPCARRSAPGSRRVLSCSLAPIEAGR